MLSFARDDAWFITTSLLADLPNGRGGKCNTIYLKDLLFFFPGVWKRQYQLLEKRYTKGSLRGQNS